MRFDYVYGFHPGMHNGMGFVPFGGIFFLILILLLIFLIYKLYQNKKQTSCACSTPTKTQNASNPLEILETRLVNGEINVEEFLNTKKAIQTNFTPEPTKTNPDEPKE